MKKRYPFLSKTWLRLSLTAAFAASVSFNLHAQNGPAKQWDKTIGGNQNDALFSLKQTSDGGYILGGSSTSGIGGDKSQATQGSADFWVVKTDANGNKLWDKTIGGSDSDGIFSLQQTSDGGYILGGTSTSGIGGDKSQDLVGNVDFWVVKLDATGTKVWDKTLGGTGSDYVYALQRTSDGGYLIGGSSNSGIGGDKTQTNQGGNDYWIVKLDASGNKLWDKTLAGSTSDGFGDFAQTTDGGYILGGMSDSGISSDKTQASKGSFDFWIVKLAPEVLGIKDPESTSPLSISPNPNQGKFSLQLSNLSASTAEVTVSDLLGREVLKQEIPVTNNQLSEELTIPNAKGLYLLQLKSGEQFLTRKIVVE